MPFSFKDPLISLELNGNIRATIAFEEITQRVVLTLTGNNNPEVAGGYYSPLDLRTIPSLEDTSSFAQVFHQVSILVSECKLSGPTGEDHPWMGRFFIYTTDMSVQETLRELETADLTVRIKGIRYKTPLEKTKEEKRFLFVAIESLVTEIFGRWMTESTEVVLPTVTIIEGPEEQKAIVDDTSRTDESLRRNFFWHTFAVVITWLRSLIRR